MKHVKRFLLLALFCLIPLSSALADDVPFTYTSSDGAITITGYTGPGGNVEIPDTIDGYPVTTIGAVAFFFKNNIASVVIPNSVTTIGESAFSPCTSLTNVVFGSAVASLGEAAFCGCTNLSEVVIPDSVASIGDWAFGYCSGLTNVLFGSGVTSIGERAFYDCAGLTEVLILDSVTRIGDWAFCGCTSLTNISVVAENQNYASIGGVLYDKALATLVQFPAALISPYVIPDSVTTIGNYAFFGCTGFTEMLIPASVTRIGDTPFIGCTSLTNIAVADENPSYASLGGVLFDKTLTTLVQVPVGLVGSYTIPGSVTSISSYAFLKCTGLKNVVIGGSVTTIGDYAFDECTGLTKVVIGSGVTSIGPGAFDECTGLTEVVIGSGVTSIGSHAFACCYSLQQVYFQGNEPTAPDDVFFGVNSGTVYYLDGTTGWRGTFNGWPTALFAPPKISIEGIGMQPDGNGFGFYISYSGDSSVVVEASTNLLDWTPVSTNILNGGLGNFSDPSSIHYPVRYYRMVIP